MTPDVLIILVTNCPVLPSTIFYKTGKGGFTVSGNVARWIRWMTGSLEKGPWRGALEGPGEGDSALESRLQNGLSVDGQDPGLEF